MYIIGLIMVIITSYVHRPSSFSYYVHSHIYIQRNLLSKLLLPHPLITIFPTNCNELRGYTEVKRNSLESQDLESISSESDTQEVRPGWPPDDMCADSTRYKQSFSERERQGLQLLSPAVRGKIIKLQRDLEEARAESRYLRAQPANSPAVAVSAVKFTRTPVPRYDGISDWDQYREVYEAIVISNGWDDLTAALQLLV